VTQRQHPLARHVSSITSNLIKVVILINDKITVKAVFNYGKCKKFLLNLVVILQLLGEFVPRPPTGFTTGPYWGTLSPDPLLASLLDPTGGLLSPDPLNQPSLALVCSTNTIRVVKVVGNGVLLLVLVVVVVLEGNTPPHTLFPSTFSASRRPCLNKPSLPPQAILNPPL